MGRSSLLTLVAACLILGCEDAPRHPPSQASETFLVVLGIAQDAGYPQINCEKSCCARVWQQSQLGKMVTSLGIVDQNQGKHWIIDATPDFKDQWHYLKENWNTELAGVFLTHAHMGHYTGLMQLGREALGGDRIPVYAMPRMRKYLESNGPWDQLVSLANIDLQSLQSDSAIALGSQLSIMPVLVPHRDEYSETVGYRIKGKDFSSLFIPDIDKWEKWELDIREEIMKVDVALIDGSFFQNGELPGRDMSTIPHPFVEESMHLMKGLDPHQKSKVHFIHFNHTNPLLQEQSEAYTVVMQEGFQVAKQGTVYPL